MIRTDDDILEHFGAKGMKWGIRKDRGPKSSDELVKQARLNVKTALKPSTDARLERIFLNKPLKYSDLSSKPLTMKRGQEFYRTTKRKDEQLQGMTYVSYKKADRDRYRAVMASQGSIRFSKSSYSPTFETVFKTTKKLTGPSERERFDAFVELMDTPSIPVRMVTGRTKTLTGREYLSRTDPTARGKKFKNLESRAIGEKYYNKFVTQQWRGKLPINTAYFNVMSQRGHRVISDDNDRGVVSDAPLMILNPKTTLREISTTRLTNDDINRAHVMFKPMIIKP